MPMLTADEVDRQLGKLQAGACSAEALGDWARDMRMEREPESEAVGEVLARMQQLGRGDHLPQDLAIMRDALRARDAVAMLHRHFAGKAEATRDPEFERTILEHGRKAMDTLARQRRAQAKAWNMILVPWIVGGFVLGQYLDDPDDLKGLDLVIMLAYCALLPAAGYIVSRFLPRRAAPTCPVCGTDWSKLTNVDYGDLMESRRCPNCRAQF